MCLEELSSIINQNNLIQMPIAKLFNSFKVGIFHFLKNWLDIYKKNMKEGG